MMSFRSGKSLNTLEFSSERMAMLSSVMKWPWNDSRWLRQLAECTRPGMSKVTIFS